MVGCPENDQVIKVLTLTKPEESNSKFPLPMWLICNGMSMGRWTINFGVHCLADDGDNIKFVKNIHEVTPGSRIVEMELHCGQVQLKESDDE